MADLAAALAPPYCRIRRRPRGFARRAGLCAGVAGLSNSQGSTALLDASLAISRPRAAVLMPSAAPLPLSIRLLTRLRVDVMAADSRGQRNVNCSSWRKDLWLCASSATAAPAGVQAGCMQS